MVKNNEKGDSPGDRWYIKKWTKKNDQELAEPLRIYLQSKHGLEKWDLVLSMPVYNLYVKCLSNYQQTSKNYKKKKEHYTAHLDIWQVSII